MNTPFISKFCFFAMAALTVTACSKHTPATRALPIPGPGPSITGVQETAFALKYVDVEIGTGPSAELGREVSVHYTGWLVDSSKFDSSHDRNEPIKFVLGTGRVIPGWDYGLVGMRVGGKRRLIIPYQLAYGSKGRNTIPPKAELTFDVEMMAVDSVLGAAVTR